MPLNNYRPWWLWDVADVHRMMPHRPGHDDPVQATWECGGCAMETGELPHLTPSGRWCGERQEAAVVAVWSFKGGPKDSLTST